MVHGKRPFDPPSPCYGGQAQGPLQLNIIRTGAPFDRLRDRTLRKSRITSTTNFQKKHFPPPWRTQGTWKSKKVAHLRTLNDGSSLQY
jgi:hypothetical protein